MTCSAHLFFLAAVCAAAAAAAAPAVPVDVLVYGATPCGVLAADAAAAEDPRLRVALLDPRALVGGAMAGGLGNTDVGSDARVFGGRTRKFFEQVAAAYGGAPGSAQYTFEPHVAEAIFRDYFLASKPNLTLYSSTRIVAVATEPDAAAGAGARRIANVTTAGGAVFAPRVLIDASYEGFLLPLAGVSFAFGREPAAQYNESAAGVSDVVAHPGVYTVQPALFAAVDPHWPDGSLLPLLQAPPGALGTGDNRTQAYMFRVVTTAVPGKFLQPWPRPSRYNATQFELFRRLQAARSDTRALLGPCSNLPNGKCDSNSQYFDQQGPGFSWDYPAAVAAGDWAAQEAIWANHRDFQLGLAYFLQNEPSLPPAVRASMGAFGLPLDEFPLASGTPVAGFPPQLYVRETLRMVSDFVLTQADRETAVNKSDSVGMGCYSIDALPVTRFARFNASAARNETALEGGIQAPAFLPRDLPPFQLPYRALVPPRAQATNLLVPGALSASHMAFCAVRIEPAWMVLGESAGVAAAAAAAAAVAVQDLDVIALQARLRQLGQVLEL